MRAADSAAMVMDLDQTFMQALYGRVVVLLVDEKLHVDLAHGLMDGLHINLLIRQCCNSPSENATRLKQIAIARSRVSLESAVIPSNARCKGTSSADTPRG